MALTLLHAMTCAADTHVYAARQSGSLELELFRPRGTGPFPTVLVLHGGGWVGGNRREMNAICAELVRAGFAAATASYRFAPAHPWPAQVQDAKEAVTFLRANGARLGLRTDKLGTLGFSAGGHMASMLGTAATGKFRVQAVVSISGIHDLAAPLTPDGERYQIVQKLLAERPGDSPSRRPGASPITHVTGRSAPHYFLQGKSDPLVPASQSTAMQSALQSKKVPSVLDLVDGMGHGLNPSRAAERAALGRAAAWLHRQIG